MCCDAASWHRSLCANLRAVRGFCGNRRGSLLTLTFFRTGGFMHKETERREKAEYIAREIIAEARGRLVLHFPYLDQAIYGLRPHLLKTVPFGSDGSFLFYDPFFLIEQYEQDENAAVKLLLHTTLHMLFRQALVGARIRRPLWNLACDIAVEYLIESFDLSGLKSGRAEARRDLYGKLQRDGVYMSAEAIYAWLCGHPPADPEHVLYRDLFLRDFHGVWYRREDGMQIPDVPDLLNWEEIRQDAASLYETENEDKNPLFLELLRGRRKPKADYSQFLRRFLARTEIMRPSATEFDCGLYRVSGRLYGPVRLIEPLECSDDPHLTELLIAIDTSGSVKGKRVRRFVQRTCDILCGRDVFAPGTKICIVQCDDRIRDVCMIRSRTELDAYLTDLRLSGFGQTDFRPVFELAAEYVRRAEFADLAGVFYFTDGDGVYPKKAPSFETVFVIDSDVPGRMNVPPWAVRVDMDEDSFGSEEK